MAKRSGKTALLQQDDVSPWCIQYQQAESAAASNVLITRNILIFLGSNLATVFRRIVSRYLQRMMPT
jgi:hypothetical protein